MPATNLTNAVTRRIPHDSKIVEIDLIPPGTLRIRVRTPRRDDEELRLECEIMDLLDHSDKPTVIHPDMLTELESVVIGHPMLEEKESIKLWRCVRDMRTGKWPEEDERP